MDQHHYHRQPHPLLPPEQVKHDTICTMYESGVGHYDNWNYCGTASSKITLLGSFSSFHICNLLWTAKSLYHMIIRHPSYSHMCCTLSHIHVFNYNDAYKCCFNSTTGTCFVHYAFEGLPRKHWTLIYHDIISLSYTPMTTQFTL